MLIVHLFVSYAHINLCHFFSSSWCQGLAATSACGSSWTFLFTFLNENIIATLGVVDRWGGVGTGFLVCVCVCFLLCVCVFCFFFFVFFLFLRNVQCLSNFVFLSIFIRFLQFFVWVNEITP